MIQESEDNQLHSDNDDDEDDEYYSVDEEEEENVETLEVIDEKTNKKSRPYIPKNLAKNYDPLVN